MRSSSKLATVALIAALATPLTLVAQPGGHHRHHGWQPGLHAGFALGVAFERLDLEEGQRQQLHDLLAAHRDEMQSAYERLGDARRELFDLALAESLDEAALRAAGARVGELETEMALGRAQLMGRLGEVLTPEQLAEARAMHERFRDRHPQGHGPGLRRGPGRGGG